MGLSLHMLARDDGSLYKLAPFLIFLVIWGLGAIASIVNKSKAKQRQTPPAPPFPPPVQLRPQPVVQRVAPMVPRSVAPSPSLPPLPTLAAKAPRAKKPVRKPAPPPLPQTSASVAPQASPPAPSMPIVPPGVPSVAWLRPQTVRSQFVLSEILRRPVALQDRPHLPSL